MKTFYVIWDIFAVFMSLIMTIEAEGALLCRPCIVSEARKIKVL